MTQLEELELGAPAAGGGFVARDRAGRVLFVRHGLEGERVMASVTEEHATWGRADAVEVLEASPHRVEPPCHFAGPGGCGGCDYQHVELGEQRRIKSALLAAQLRGVDLSGRVVEVAAAAAGGDGLGTRTRVRFAVDAAGGTAMRRHRSHDLVAVDRCALGVRGADSVPVAALGLSLAEGTELEVMALGGSASPTVSVITRSRGRASRLQVLSDPGFAARQSTEVLGRRYVVSPGVFWQVHDRAAELLTDAVVRGLGLDEGDAVCDLYCGAGLFTKAIAEVVGATGRVHGVDSSRRAIDDARASLSELPWARVTAERVDERSAARASKGCTHVVVDPPRAGIDAGALRAVSANLTVRTLVSVSCDAATFARDLGRLVAQGWRIDDVQALDLFEMTEHLECVAVLRR